MSGHQFKPGQSGNPAGIPRWLTEAKQVARKHLPEAIQEAIRIMRECDDMKWKTWAIEFIADRSGFVAPKQPQDDATDNSSTTTTTATAELLKIVQGETK